MKAALLLCSLLLSSTISFAVTRVAFFENYGKVEITSDRQGLRLHMDLQLEPRQRYMVRLTSSCQTVVSYRTYFRQSLAVSAISDKNGVISSYSRIPGINENDLSSRELNTLSLFKLEKSHWTRVKCVALQEHEKARVFKPEEQSP